MENLTWEKMLELFPILKELNDCPQDKVWHREGTVGTHTKMVVDALDNPDQNLFMGACFHDIGKLKTTENKAGRIVAPKHAKVGAKMVKNLLFQDYPAELPALTIESILDIINLVRLHGVPVWAWESQGDIVRSTLHLSGERLATLARADIAGRITADKLQLLDEIALYELMTLENECFDTPFKFKDDFSRFFYLENPNIRYPNYQAYDNSRGKLILMAGMPGAGKDTWLDNVDLPVVSLDWLRDKMDIRPYEDQKAVANAAYDMAKEFFRQKQSFVWNGTNLTKRIRRLIITRALDYGFKVEIFYLHTSWKNILARNNNGERVPLAVLLKMANILEIPEYTEAHSVFYLNS